MLPYNRRRLHQPGWLTPQSFADVVSISQMTPGPIGINAATFVGYITGGVAGPFSPPSPPFFCPSCSSF
jgi:chromate transporter